MKNNSEHIGERQARLLDGTEYSDPLHICPAGCGCQSVHAIGSAEIEDDETSFLLKLRCPDCREEFSGVFDMDRVLALEERNNDAHEDMSKEALRADLYSIGRENAATVARFSSALDHILPDDF
jgi:hypothetical protein